MSENKMIELRTKRGNLVTRDMGKNKHQSKLYWGFMKMIADQNAKPSISQVDTGLISWDEDEGEYLPLMQKFPNSRWNGMNLKELASKVRIHSPAEGYYRRIYFNENTGMYKLSQFSGKQRLKTLRAKRARRLTDES